MTIPFDQIRNKQRILIGGNHGASEIFDLCRQLATSLGKKADFVNLSTDANWTLTDAPTVIMTGADHMSAGTLLFHELNPHILLVHSIQEKAPNGFQSFEHYLAEYERLADALPKAGTLIFFEGDNVATLLGKKEREDVKNLEYATLKHKQKEEGVRLKKGDFEVVMKDVAESFADIAAGARALLNRLGISDEQFFGALSKL